MDRRDVLVGGAGAALLTSAGCLGDIEFGTGRGALDTTGEWRRPEFDAAATGYNPDVTGPIEAPSKRWEAEAPIDSAHAPAVVASDGVAYFAGGSTVTALDVADGSQRWQTRVAEEYVLPGAIGTHCSVALDDERVYVGTHEGLTALARDGEELWSHEVPAKPGASGAYRSPAVYDGSVYFCVANNPDEGALLAYTTDGNQRWRYELPGPLDGGPAVTETGVYVTDADGGLNAFAHGGERRWRVDASVGTQTPTVYDGAVHVTGARNDLGRFVAAFDSDGDRQWRNSGGPLYHQPLSVTDDEFVVALSTNGSLFGYNVEDGATWWGASVGYSPGDPYPVADDRGVYVVDDGRVTHVDNRRRTGWQVDVEGATGGISLLDGALLVGSTEGRCYALA